jgi:hypothetical protein
MNGDVPHTQVVLNSPLNGTNQELFTAPGVRFGLALLPKHNMPKTQHMSTNFRIASKELGE